MQTTSAQRSDHQKYTLLQEAALKNGGVLLSQSYVGYREKYRFRCAIGHEWETTAATIWSRTKPSWCKICKDTSTAQKNRLTLQDMQQDAAKRGGFCLATSYEGIFEYYQWQCAQEHIWRAQYNNIRNKKWCLDCSLQNSRSFPRKKCKKYKKRQTKETYYENLGIDILRTTPTLILHCRTCKYMWQRRYSALANECPVCARKSVDSEKRRKGFARLQDYITLRKGNLLEDGYLGYRIPHRLRCKDRHEWSAKPHDLLIDKTWCRICSNKKEPKYTFLDLDKTAKTYDGICLSKKYLGYEANHKFVCKNGHHFWSSLNRILSAGDWCSHCKTHNHIEERVRRGFEAIFGCKFVRTNPIWLKVAGKRHAYQIDGYNEAKKLAFEYNGKQHDHVVKYIKHDNEEKLQKRKANDLHKRMICVEQGVYILEISWKDATTTKKIADACLQETH